MSATEPIRTALLDFREGNPSSTSVGTLQQELEQRAARYGGEGVGDLVNEVFCKLLGGRIRWIKSEDEAERYLWTCVKHAHYDCLRKARRFRESLKREASPGPRTPEVFVALGSDAILRVLNQLVEDAATRRPDPDRFKAEAMGLFVAFGFGFKASGDSTEAESRCPRERNRLEQRRRRVRLWLEAEARRWRHEQGERGELAKPTEALIRSLKRPPRS